jgi:tetratricopeptide (TPR) repeat protein
MGIPAALTKDILDRARALQEQLIKSGQLTPELRRSEAAALDETATSLLAIGDTAGALAAAEQARQIMADLLASNPGNAGWQDDLSVSYNKVGDVQLAQGDLAGALKSYRDGFAIAKRLSQSDPGNAGWQRDLAVGYATLARVYRQSNDREKALAALRAGKAIMDRLVKLSSDNAGWRRDFAWFDKQIAALTE